MPIKRHDIVRRIGETQEMSAQYRKHGTTDVWLCYWFNREEWVLEECKESDLEFVRERVVEMKLDSKGQLYA